ncbi:hypothetical protein, partial [Amycolatopsis sp. H20-H5]|uniref:hypothetical protein n=1 Tax=Amycolatopsis sp. H20-H5 TaxID=3046309 RepID=UPI002DB57E01
MSKGNEAESSVKPAEKSGVRIASVLAAALAAVTAAVLGSTLGVAGTVLGAGVGSIVTTVGGELYLRSLQRTRDAAAKAREALATSGGRRIRAQQDLTPQDRAAPGQTVLLPVNPADQPTVNLRLPSGESGTGTESDTETSPGQEPSRLRKLRWPLVIGTSVLAFVVAIIAITGFEGATGQKLGGNGNGGTTLFGGGSGHSTEQQRDTPSTKVSTTPSETPDAPPSTTTPSGTSTPTTTPTTDSAPPTTPTTPKT